MTACAAAVKRLLSDCAKQYSVLENTQKPNWKTRGDKPLLTHYLGTANFALAETLAYRGPQGAPVLCSFLKLHRLSERREAGIKL